MRKMIEHGHVPVADAMQHDDVPDQVGVGLLPERFFALAPDGDDDGGDVERLRVGVGIAVERVIANVAIERDIDIILSPPAAFQYPLHLTAQVAFHLKHDAGEPAQWIAGAIREELPHGRQDDGLGLAGADGPDDADTCVETALRDRQPARGR